MSATLSIKKNMSSSYRVVKVERQTDVARNMQIFVTLLCGRAKNRAHFLTMSATLAPLPPPKKNICNDDLGFTF